MKTIKISYILPCYNIEKYVAKCIESICNQGLDEEKFEIICVNDCSPDKTRDVIVALQAKHKNLHLIDHEKNMRVGAARNTGFRAAKGEYVWFIDPDDIIHSDAPLELLPIMDKDNLDFIQFGHDWMTEDEVPIANPSFNLNCPFDTEVMSGIDFLHEYQKRHMSYSDMHSGPFVRIYRRSYLLENNILYPEVAYYEDQYQALHGLLAAKRMRNVNKCYYSYREVVNSYSHAPMSTQKRAGQVIMCVGMVRMMHDYHLSDKDIRFVWKRYEQDLQYFNTHFVLFMPKEERNTFIDLIHDELPQLHRLLPHSSWLLAICPSVYKSYANIFSVPLKRIRDVKRKWIKA